MGCLLIAAIVFSCFAFGLVPTAAFAFLAFICWIIWANFT